MLPGRVGCGDLDRVAAWGELIAAGDATFEVDAVLTGMAGNAQRTGREVAGAVPAALVLRGWSGAVLPDGATGGALCEAK